ncbi:tRNA (guanine(37)-N1)-methyltransferase [Strongyloides ratti]|uniref:tRNA (guanine(37)-N1)-methyltransferase n=1 Tax=Strongyloides ratti TaxID=34506 RepID=A0A090KWH8_STRRB|nr:tRNA (guanine(37)-N1)-methyltransferase [Strongyloides ratti]CEF61761.1 tRNA (guanine(37)-N1)-methyltransferase [Strongyloides ratti]
MIDPLKPPENVRGMVILDKEKFNKNIILPTIEIPSKIVSRIIGSQNIKDYSIPTMNKIKAIMENEDKKSKLLVLNPENFDEIKIKETIEYLTNIETKISMKSFTLKYEDYDIKRLIKSILPDSLEFSGYSQIGHIAHFNLQKELLPYKYIIAQIVLDKISWCKTVVNKLDTITTEFRFFKMELLAGEENYLTVVVEDGLKYKMDFSKVFWNSRLSNEHKRIVKKLDKNSVVYDGFAGVGPFVLPAIKKGVKKVFGNDLNPESVKWMETNIEINKMKNKNIKIFNMDAKDFFKIIVRNDLLSYKDSIDKPSNCHIIMNLPALAVTFLPYLEGLLKEEKKENYNFDIIVHVHLFVKSCSDVPFSWFFEEASRIVRSNINIPNLEFLEIHNVRNVASRKEMFCASFKLPSEFLFSISESDKKDQKAKELFTDEIVNKKIKLN